MLSSLSNPLRALLAVFITALMVGPAAAQIVPLPPLPSSVPVDVPFTAVQDVYAEDFNVDDGGWTNVTDSPPRTSWAWGVPTSGPAAAASGANVWATRLDGDYLNAECGALLSPPIVLPTDATASASFREWRHFEMSATIAWDAGLLFVTDDDGASYDLVVPDIGYTSPGISTTVRACLGGLPTGAPGLSGPAGTDPPAPTYSDIAVSLDAYSGRTVRLAIAFGTDSVVTRAGWYVDDFTVIVNGVATVEDFEASDGGFTAVEWNLPGVAPKGWSWGVPSTGPTPGPGAFSMWATDPEGNHGNNECSYIESAPIDLTLAAGTNVFLEWRQWFRGNFGAGGVVQIGNATGYTNAVPENGYGATNPSTALDACLQHVTQGSRGFGGLIDPIGGPLRAYTADVSAFLGQTITVRFLFAATSTVTPLPGWYVDDLLVVAGVGGQSETIEVPMAPPLDETNLFVPVATVYEQDFNFDDGGWHENGTEAWQWGDSESPPEQLPGSLRLWGTRLLDDYTANECSSLTSVPITLPAADPGAGLTLARLSFHLWRSTQNLFDGAHLEASTDGGATWTRVDPDGGYDAPLSNTATATLACLGVTVADPVWTGPAAVPAADAWLNVTADVTPFMGRDVELRFVFGSNPTTQRRGVYIDNVIVQVGSGASLEGLGLCPALPRWEVTGHAASWCYGVPSTGPQTPRPVWATNLHGPHNRSECSAIEYGPIDTNQVPGLGTLTLAFNHYFRAGSTIAGGLVQVSRDDGATWSIVNPVGGYPASLGTLPRACLAPGATSQTGFTGTTMSGYDPREVRLGGYQGDTIKVRFAFGAGTGTPDLGWYINGVQLSRGAGGVPLTPLSGPPGGDAGAMALFAKADPWLLRTLETGRTDGLELLVTGKPHPRLTEADFSSRAEAMAALDELAAPFFSRIEDIARSTGAEVVGTWSAAPAVKLRGNAFTALAAAEDEETESVSEDGPDRVRLIDPIEDDSFGTDNTAGRNMLQAEDIWALGFQGEGITIAVIDTGVDPTHEALKFANGTSRIAGWANCITTGSTCNTAGPILDDNGHGTHVSATALGSDEYVDPVWGAFQEKGVAPKATLYGVKFLSGAGSGSFADGVKALQWAFDNGADITSNSWGSSCSASLATLQAVRQLTDLGMLSVFAAGNSGPGAGSVGGPACSESALSVGAVDANEVIASFSSRGPCSDPDTGTPSRTCPDVVAKGVSVRSAIPRSGATYADPTGYKVWQGTSMATPHVAGAAALSEQMKRYYTGTGWNTPLRAEEEVFKLTSKDLGDAGPDNTFGWGLPQLTNIYLLLNSADEAVIVSTFGISKSLVRLGDSTTLSFSVRNMGGAPATGDFLATLEHPGGLVQQLKASTVTLSLLDGESMISVFTVGGNVAPGDYVLRGTFDYTWTDPATGDLVQGSVFHEGSFVVKRVFISFAVDGLASTAHLLELQTVNVRATNTGNEDGASVVIEFTVPDSYLFVPGPNYNPLQPRTRYSNPAPDSVYEDENFGRITLIYEVGTLAAGGNFSFEMQLLPTEMGQKTFIAAAKFSDGGGNAYTMGVAFRQTVGLPAP